MEIRRLSMVQQSDLVANQAAYRQNVTNRIKDLLHREVEIQQIARDGQCLIHTLVFYITTGVNTMYYQYDIDSENTVSEVIM